MYPLYSQQLWVHVPCLSARCLASLRKEGIKKWIKLRGFHHLDNVIKGVQFRDGKMVENGDKFFTGEQLIQEAA